MGLRTLFSFTPASAGPPYGGVVFDKGGNLVGAIPSGPAKLLFGCVYQLSLTGIEHPLHVFNGRANGGNPAYDLILDAAGNVYGVAEDNNGTVFKIAPGGAVTVLHSFTGSDGSKPAGPAVFDAAGDLYGATRLGGKHGFGTIFKLTRNGLFTSLYPFTNGLDGAAPNGGLVLDHVGNIYGTASAGGAHQFGVVFQLTPAGILNPLYPFTGTTDGANPVAGLVFDSAGALCGTTTGTGIGVPAVPVPGTVFRLALTGAFDVLSTCGPFNQGPWGRVAFDAARRLYVTTLGGGKLGLGSILQLVPPPPGFPKPFPYIAHLLYSFTGALDGSAPASTLTVEQGGGTVFLYGTTTQNGGGGLGTVFEFEVP